MGGSERTRRRQAQAGPKAPVNDRSSKLLMQRPEDLVRATRRQTYGELKKWFHKLGLKWIHLGTSSRLILGS